MRGARRENDRRTSDCSKNIDLRARSGAHDQWRRKGADGSLSRWEVGSGVGARGSRWRRAAGPWVPTKVARPMQARGPSGLPPPAKHNCTGTRPAGNNRNAAKNWLALRHAQWLPVPSPPCRDTAPPRHHAQPSKLHAQPSELRHPRRPSAHSQTPPSCRSPAKRGTAAGGRGWTGSAWGDSNRRRPKAGSTARGGVFELGRDEVLRGGTVATLDGSQGLR